MAIELYGPDAAGYLTLLEDPTPERPTDQATAPPAGEPPLPGADATPPAGDTPAPDPTDDLAALRRLIEAREARDRERDAKDLQRDTQVETMTRLLRGDVPPETTPPGPAPRPTAEAFTSHDDYVEAVADWKAEQKLTAFREEQQQAQQASAQQQAQQTLEARVKQAEDAFQADHPDYRQVVQQGLVSKTPQDFRQFLMAHLESDAAPAVAYALAKDEALLARLFRMPPPQLIYALGRLSAQHGGSAAPPGSTSTATPAGGLPPGGVAPGLPADPGRPKPPPPRPLSGTGVAPVGGYSDSMTMDQYRLWRKNMGGH